MHNMLANQITYHQSQRVPYRCLNCFGHVIYGLKTTYPQIIEKSLTHPRMVIDQRDPKKIKNTLRYEINRGYN